MNLRNRTISGEDDDDLREYYKKEEAKERSSI